MITVGAFEARTHLSSLLERVAQGEEIIITRHGKPLARGLFRSLWQTVPGSTVQISKLKALRKNCTLDGMSLQELRDEGRR